MRTEHTRWRRPGLPHVVNVSFPPEDDAPIDGEMLILNLDMQGVLISSGLACTSGALEPSHVLRLLNHDRPTGSAAVRFSLGKSTTVKSINCAIDKLEITLKRLRC